MSITLVGDLISETILLDRISRCDHEWKAYNAHEDQCQKCTVIVTPEGKETLRRRREALLRKMIVL